MNEKTWNRITPEQKMDLFERVGLSGIHFNEDDENNWAEYNYGDCSWSKLTDKMKDQLEASFY
ncbi:MAG: hypothetical protein HOI55_14685 [Candidatus Marinimicrobia bacterium]|jgi:hypothetical protein|nr:hypothetical protein [Candidatus Neomarinimicrobiota bacterium]